MPRHYKVLGLLLVTIVGIYGCAKGPGGTASGSGSGATAKAQKLEEDYRAAVAARDQFRQRVSVAEEQAARARRELEQARAEREALKGEVKARAGERDAVNAQFEAFRKNLKELLGTADTAVGALNLPAPKPSPEHSARN